ncbi:MAG TPA: hypothetical protein VF077_08235 [Nitrospiraceae bacterium]
MTPLHVLLVQAIEDAKRREPGLKEAEIARRAGLERAALSRAKTACGPHTLAAVLDVLGFDLALKKKMRDR